jgi:hypothetical protein
VTSEAVVPSCVETTGSARIHRFVDPNWFYSTLAQSTAAIVGLAAAFLASRLVVQRDELTRLREPVRRRLRQLATTIVEEYGLASAIEATARAAIDESVKGGEVSDETLFKLRSFSHPDIADESLWPEPTAKDVLALAELAADARAFRETLPSGATEGTDVSVAAVEEELAYAIKSNDEYDYGMHWQPYGPQVPEWLYGERETERFSTTTNFFEELPKQRAYAAARYAKISDLWNAVQGGVFTLRARVVPGSFFALLGVLALLLAVGGIIPMAYLSAREGASKALLLAGFAVLSLGVLLLLAIEVRRLQSATDLTE